MNNFFKPNITVMKIVTSAFCFTDFLAKYNLLFHSFRLKMVVVLIYIISCHPHLHYNQHQKSSSFGCHINKLFAVGIPVTIGRSSGVGGTDVGGAEAP
jgi:hypothetical protein